MKAQHLPLNTYWKDKQDIFNTSTETRKMIFSQTGILQIVKHYKMAEYRMKTGKIGEKAVGAYKKIEDAFTDTFLNEDGSLRTGGMAEKATSAYQKIEDGVVGAYKKVESAFVDAFLEKVKLTWIAMRRIFTKISMYILWK